LGSINEHIIRDFSVGQEKAFRILYEKYAPALRYFAAKYVEEVIDDIVQDVFVCLWEKRVDFKTEETIKAFLYKAVKNSCLNTIRHQGVKDRYAEVALHEEELESFWDHILETELFELLLGVFNELPPACREVYRLSLEGKKHEEIAEILQITVNTVKKHKNNANHYMRERLKHILSLLVLCQFP
jgi:RNA polymerase sigma-70 factor (family 1)